MDSSMKTEHVNNESMTEDNHAKIALKEVELSVKVAEDLATKNLEIKVLNLNNQEAAYEKQLSGKSEMFESSLVASPHGASFEVQNRQQPNSTSPAGWFPTLTQVMNESQGRKKNEEIISKVTNWSFRMKTYTPRMEERE
ncbi:hypothetical protein SESBI_02915 [Sesbania bispinosa]|nr:hypothetical protein SESBI_02915 [Sesbania bispinosa]